MDRFLIVDNSPTARRALTTEITRLWRSAQVLEVDRTEPAVEADAAWRPDAVFLGLLLAAGDRGVTVLRRMLASRPERPIVVCTSLPPEHPEVVEAMSLGAFACIPKPVPPAALRHTIVQMQAYRGNFRSIR